MGITLFQPASHCDTSRGAAYFLRNSVHRMRICTAGYSQLVAQWFWFDRRKAP